MNAVAAASETPVVNEGLNVGPEQDSSSTLHFQLMTTTTGKAWDIVGNAGESEGLETWRRLLEFDPRAKLRGAGLTQKLLAFEFTSDSASFELCDKECLGLKQVTGIDSQDEVKCGLVTLHMQDEMLRHHFIMHGSMLDTFCKVRGGDADRHSERQGRRARTSSGGELVQAEKKKDGAKKLAEKKKEKRCFYCQNKGTVKSDCRNRQCDTTEAKDSGKLFVDRKQTAAISDDEITGVVRGHANHGSHDNVFAVTEKPSLGNHAVRWKRVVLLIISLVTQPVSVLQESDVSRILVHSGPAVAACPGTRSRGANHPWPRKSVAGMNNMKEFLGKKFANNSTTTQQR